MVSLFVCFPCYWTELNSLIAKLNLDFYSISIGRSEWGPALCDPCHVPVLGQLHWGGAGRVLLHQKETGWLDEWIIAWVDDLLDEWMIGWMDGCLDSLLVA